MSSQIFINKNLFWVNEEQITKTQNPTDKTLWTITVKNVPLSAGENTIRFVPRNADSRVLNTPKNQVTWTPPPPPPKPLPSRPKIYFANFNDQVPLAGYWQGDEFTLAFNVLAGAKLKSVEVYNNNERLEPLEIPQPIDGVKYHFQVPVKLTRQRNELRVIASDENLLSGQESGTLALLKPPVTVVIDRLEVPNQNVILEPQKSESRVVTFARPAPKGRVVLRGRVITSDSTMKFKRPYVKCWVNGFLQWARANPNPKKPTEWTFAMNLTLNQKKNNRLYLELPEAPKSPFSQTRCLVDCKQPETKQNLHMVLVGINPANRRSIDTAKLENQAKEAFSRKGGRAAAFEKTYFHPIPIKVDSSRINSKLWDIHCLSKPEAEKGAHDVVVFYYQGEEVLNSQNEIVLRTQDRVEDNAAFTDEDLKKKLSEMYGAHLVLLDLSQPKAAAKKWETGQFLGMLRSVHKEAIPQGDFPLISALEKALPNTKDLDELPGQIMQAFPQGQSTPAVDNSVPEDLKRIIVGEKP